MSFAKEPLKMLVATESSGTRQNEDENPYRRVSPELDTQTVAMLRTQVETILQSDSFVRSKRMHRFLSFTVDQALKGNSDSLNECSIARAVFDKGESFDPCLDPIVRIEMGRLRSKLRQYYEDEARDDTLVIHYPKRSYTPTFRFIIAASSAKPSAAHAGMLNAIAILPFTDFNPRKSGDHFCDTLTEELTNMVGRLTKLRVVARTSTLQFKGKPIDVRKIGVDLGVDAVLEGNVQRENDRIRISIGLVEVRNGFRVWTTTYDLKTNGSFNIQEALARRITDLLKKKLQPEGNPAKSPR
jgi:TolB-like protein